MKPTYIRAKHKKYGTKSWQEILPSWLLEHLKKDGWEILEIR